MEYAEEDLLIPQWAIVVIVIGVGSLVFVVIFGITVVCIYFALRDQWVLINFINFCVLVTESPKSCKEDSYTHDQRNAE